HPGIERIVEAAAAINPRIHLIAGGFHLVIASDEVIAKAVAALKGTFKVENVAPGHCTGEPTFAALKKAFGDRYLYAGLGTTLPLGANTGSDMRRGEGPALQQDDLTTYRRLARREDPFGILQARRLRTKALQRPLPDDALSGLILQPQSVPLSQSPLLDEERKTSAPSECFAFWHL